MKIKFHLKIDVFVALQALISVEILQPKIEELKIQDFNVFSCFCRQKIIMLMVVVVNAASARHNS